MNEADRHASAVEWLEAAQGDLAVSADLLALRHWQAAPFHAQQAAEKALKSVISANDYEVVFPPTDEEVEALVILAHEFVERVRDLLT